MPILASEAYFLVASGAVVAGTAKSEVGRWSMVWFVVC